MAGATTYCVMLAAFMFKPAGLAHQPPRHVTPPKPQAQVNRINGPRINGVLYFDAAPARRSTRILR
jgi:hypothetical protein